jgi:penicillin-binding protein 2
VVDAVAVLDSGVMTASERVVCTGLWTYEDDTRYDWYTPGHGTVTVETALMQSCNPYFYTTGFKLNERDPYLLPQYARRMGLGAVTGLGDIPEDPGIVGDPDWMMTNYGLPWSYSDAVSFAIGQGPIGVTPLQMARVYAGIANDGNQMRPRLVREKGILDQRTFLAEPEINNTFAVKEGVLDHVHNGLCMVTTEASGTAAHIFKNSPLLEIGVCGKTGTAQDGASGNGKMSHAWFIGYAPADDPEVVVLVMVENAGEGSAVAAPLVRQIMEYYFFGPF